MQKRSPGLQRVLAVLGAAMLIVGACGGGVASQAPVGSSAPSESQAPGATTTIKVAIASSPSATALREMGKAFAAETGINVEFVEIPYSDVTTKVLLAANEGSGGYDVIQFDSPWLAPLVAGGALAPLDDRVTSDAYDISDIPVQVQEYATYKGVQYGLPFSTEPYVLWYRTDKFSEAGLSVPTNWEEYYAAAQMLTANGHYGSDSGYGAEIGGYYFLEHLYLSGGTLLDESTCKATLDTSEARAAAQMYADLVPFTPAAAINGGGNEMTTSFAQGDASQMINATGYFSIVNDPEQSKVVGNFDMAVPPRANDEARTLIFGWLIGIGENSQNKDAAWQFLEYALGKANAGKMIELGAPPVARNSLVNDAATLEVLPYLPKLVDAAAVGTHLPYLPALSQIISELSVELNKLGTGQQSVDDFMANSTAEANRILDEAGGCQ